jgi:peptidoglycan-associated lipoprotein
MKMMRFATAAVLAAALNVVLAGCKHNAPATAPQPAPPAAPTPAPAPPPSPPPPPPAPAPAPPTEEELFARTSIEELNAKKPLTDVFFDLDRADLTESGRASLQKNADWMKKWQSTKITVEGHCDSRGTTEYNLALGERRAQSTRNYLVSRGVQESRINLLSYGEERPLCTEHEESCWTQNRRAQFLTRSRP